MQFQERSIRKRLQDVRWQCNVSESQVVPALLDHAHLLFPTEELSACSRQPSHVAAVSVTCSESSQDQVVHCHLLGGGGEDGTDVLETQVVRLAFAGVSGS